MLAKIKAVWIFLVSLPAWVRDNPVIAACAAVMLFVLILSVLHL